MAMKRNALKDTAHYQGIDAGSTYLVAGLLRVRTETHQVKAWWVFFYLSLNIDRMTKLMPIT